MKINVTMTVLLPDTRVMAENYRKIAQWERGVICSTEISVWRNLEPRVTYRVRLDRKSNSGNFIFLHVGKDQVVEIGGES